MMIDLCTDAAISDVPDWEQISVAAHVATVEPLDLGDGEFAFVRHAGNGTWRILYLVVWDDSVPTEMFPPLIERKCRPEEAITIKRLLAARSVIIDEARETTPSL